MELDPTISLYVDEAGFILAKIRKCGKNVTVHRAKARMAGQRCTNITVNAAIFDSGDVAHIPAVGPYTVTVPVVLVFDDLYLVLLVSEKRLKAGVNGQHPAVLRDNVPFHHTICSDGLA